MVLSRNDFVPKWSCSEMTCIQLSLPPRPYRSIVVQMWSKISETLKSVLPGSQTEANTVSRKRHLEGFVSDSYTKMINTII